MATEAIMRDVEDFLRINKEKPREVDVWKTKRHHAPRTEGWKYRPKRTPLTAEECALSNCYERSAEAAEVEEKIEAKFNRLAIEWSDAIANVSSVSAMISHRKYREIVDLRWDALPFMLLDLQSSHRFWFPALAEITGIRPYDRRDAGNVKRMTDAWIAWGKKKKLI
jgi:hypothetical protein